MSNLSACAFLHSLKTVMAAALETFISKMLPASTHSASADKHKHESFENELVSVQETTETSTTMQVYVDRYRDAMWASLPQILTEVVIFIVLMIIGKFLWNSYLVPAVAVLRPVSSFIDILAIRILLILILPIQAAVVAQA